MVASDSPAASEIGANVLADGGNAFDAALATSFALGVARPYSTGLGGGGFMVAYLAAEKQVVVLDFREVAPTGATPERYADARAANPDGPPVSIYGGLAIGVPGLLAGLTEIHERYCTQSLDELVKPAIALARVGVPIDRHFHDSIGELGDRYHRWPLLALSHPQLRAMFMKDGQPLSIGERSTRPDYAEALTLIGQSGGDALYNGPVGAAIVKAASRAGSGMTADDLRKYTVKERKPVRGVYQGYEVISMPPPSSGGVALVETLNILSARRRIAAETFTPLMEMHLRIEAMKHAFADRARFLGDPDFGRVPVKALTTPAYAMVLARRISLSRAGSVKGYGLEQLHDDDGTSHFCVADAQGNVVAITETINGPFGSLVIAEPYGVILNNQLDDFVTESGKANLYGLVQSDANLVAPGKRPLSSMSPTLVMKDHRPVLALGASGGPRIISSVLHVLLNVLDIGLPLDEALASARTHHQWKPNVVYFDREGGAGAKALAALGHVISSEQKTGIVQAILIGEDGELVGGSDPRKGGRPAAP